MKRRFTSQQPVPLQSPAAAAPIRRGRHRGHGEQPRALLRRCCSGDQATVADLEMDLTFIGEEDGGGEAPSATRSDRPAGRRARERACVRALGPSEPGLCRPADTRQEASDGVIS